MTKWMLRIFLNFRDYLSLQIVKDKKKNDNTFYNFTFNNLSDIDKMWGMLLTYKQITENSIADMNN